MAVMGEFKMAEKLKISITQEDIDNGLMTRLDKCPISLAVTRQTGFRAITALGMTRTLNNPGLWNVYELDDTGKKFIQEFDKGKQVSPCEVTAEYKWVSSIH